VDGLGWPEILPSHCHGGPPRLTAFVRLYDRARGTPTVFVAETESGKSKCFGTMIVKGPGQYRSANFLAMLGTSDAALVISSPSPIKTGIAFSMGRSLPYRSLHRFAVERHCAYSINGVSGECHQAACL